MGSVIAGGNFWRGAKQGAIVAVYNHAVHSIAKNFSQTKGPGDGKGQQQQGKSQQERTHKFFAKLRKHYEGKTGKDYLLSKKEFNFLVKTLRKHNALLYSTERLMENGDYSILGDFYRTTDDLALSFGRSTFTFTIDSYGRRIFKSFYDVYNFDSKPWGTRSYISEIITRTYSTFVKGKSFKIIYNGVK